MPDIALWIAGGASFSGWRRAAGVTDAVKAVVDFFNAPHAILVLGAEMRGQLAYAPRSDLRLPGGS
jgi:hypothetical protein